MTPRNEEPGARADEEPGVRGDEEPGVRADEEPGGRADEEPDPRAAGERDEALRESLGDLRELLAGGLVLTAQRVQEALDDAVTRGRITHRDADDLARGLVGTGRRQAADLLAALERLLR